MAIKVNLKKYLKCGSRWQFVLVLKVKGLPKPVYVVIHGEAVKELSGEFYLEWRSDGKRRQVPSGSDPRAALDAWRTKVGILNGKIGYDPEDEEILVSTHSIRSAFDQLLIETDATQRGSTYLAYQNDLRWVQESIERRSVAQVTGGDESGMYNKRPIAEAISMFHHFLHGRHGAGELVDAVMNFRNCS